MRRAAAILAGLALIVGACGGSSGESGGAAYRTSMKTELPLLDARLDSANAATTTAIGRRFGDSKVESEQVSKARDDMLKTLDGVGKQAVPDCLGATRAELTALLEEYRGETNSLALASKILEQGDRNAYFLITPDPAKSAALKAKLKVVLLQLDTAKC